MLRFNLSSPRSTARFRIAASVVLVAALAGAACRSTSAPAAAPTPAVTADTYAVVDAKQITRTDVERAFRRLNAAQPLSDEEALTAKLGLLDDLILEEILVGKAQQLKLQVPDSELDTAYNDAKKNISDAEFQQQLTQRNLTTADMREGLRRQLLTQKVIDREVTAKAAVTDQQVTEFFNANRGQFNVPEDSYHLAQIVVTPVRDQQIANRTGDDASTPETAAAKVSMLMDRLKGGTPFGDLARDYSEDPESAPRGGDLGLVPVSAVKQAPPPLRDAVLQMAPGNARVVTQGGARTIVFVVSREAAGQRDLSTPAVKEQITTTLRQRREQLLRTAYLTSVRSDAHVVNYLAHRVLEEQGKTAAAAPPAAPLAATPPK
jgi:peptidyl-prolyl cis-trans isomerase SurA